VSPSFSFLFQPKVFLDRIHEPRAELLLLAVHRETRHLVAEPDDQVSTFAGFKSAALFLEPAFELRRSSFTHYNTFVALYNVSVVLGHGVRSRLCEHVFGRRVRPADLAQNRAVRVW
jgi:hypothetical protein